MRSTTQSFIRRRFRGFTLYISATAISGTHDVRFNTGTGEFTLQMTPDDIEGVQSVLEQAHTLIDANLPGRCRSCAGYVQPGLRAGYCRPDLCT